NQARARLAAVALVALALGAVAGGAAMQRLMPATTDVPAANAPPAGTACAGKILYYRNPMGLPDTSPTPRKDNMGMDYIPVCEEAASAPGTVRISPERVQLLGVRTEAVARGKLVRPVRAFATVQFDERRQAVIAPKFGGWIEKLHVSATGDPVARGQILFEVYSPDLNVVQREFVGARARQQAAVVYEERMRNMDYPEPELERLRQGEAPSRVIAVPSQAAGTVVEKAAVEGMRFQAGERLFRIVDTSVMWVMAEIYEQDLGYVKVGDTARVVVNALPQQPVQGRIAYIYPAVGRENRTARLRIEVANPDGKLRAEMGATVEIAAPVADDGLSVPDSAVIDSGRRQIVLVDQGEGRFEPRAVKLGARGPGWVQVLDGVAAGEKVVTAATFLIDAESNLRAALAAFTPGGESK
ncbi:MAG TPA: efflux RND transporter periplasmic adaptor subunit, partial [Vineibacter sp.]|nr:efflux RND transporter periplasmic adaptor subunit [Vineibacter sp.]